jgi:Tat protein translocase TatC
LYSQFDNEQLRYYAQTATYYRASLLIEDLAKRKKYIENFPEIDQETKDLLIILAEKQPSAALDAKGSVVYMQSLKPTETFMLAIKLSVFAGIIISFPFLLYFILQFVLPGLKKNERKALWPALIIGFGLFLTGVFFCYFLVLPKALDFFFTYSSGMGVENEWRIGDYITFTTQFTLIFGLAFELPVVVMTLVKIGLLSYQTMSNTRSYAVLTIFLVGAIITPTGDALTLSLLAIPMCLLYEICIWLAYFNRKKELAAEALEEAEIKEYRDHQNESSDETSPVPVPVPGRISTHDDHHDDHDDDHGPYYDDHHDDYHDHHTGEEGEEFDNGAIEDFSKTIDSEATDQQGEDFHADDDSDYNQGPSFEAPPEPAEKDDKKDDGDDGDKGKGNKGESPPK